MKKKVFLPLTLIFFVASFFYGFASVNAETVTFSVSDSTFDMLSSDDFIAMREYALTKISSDSSYSDYIIFYNFSGTYYLVMHKNLNYMVVQDLTGGTYRLRYSIRSGGLTENYTYNGSSVVLSSSSTSTGASNGKYLVHNGSVVTEFWLLDYYCSPDTTSCATNSTYKEIVLVTSQNSYTIPSSETSKVLSLYDIRLSTTPVDNTPLLTSFFNITLNKLQLITEYFSSNYVYLSIFVIFIITSILLLIKRRLF